MTQRRERRVHQKDYGKKCCVWGCRNTTAYNSSDTTELSFYLFPSGNLYLPHKALRREAWLAGVRSARPGGAYWEPKEASKICSEHFVGNKKSDDPRSPSYNPTIFPKMYTEIKVNKDEIMEKHKRLLERLDMVRERMTSIETSKTPACPDAASVKLSTSCVPKKRKRALRCRLTKATQIDFPDESEKEDLPQLFLCSRYCTLGADKADAEVQVYRPRTIAAARITVDPLTIDDNDAEQRPARLH